MTDLRYPIGEFQAPAALTDAERTAFIDQIAALPGEIRQAVSGLDDAKLDTPYREGGWTVRQVVHHVPDSHLNAYTRFKLALTENTPTIKTYEEARWAELPEARSAPIDASLALLGALHERWVLLLRVLAPGRFARSFRHPELGLMTLDQQVAMYAWHGRHHLAHIASLRARMGW
ncbi:MAG TPA: putative metal-dependent hydrolase [Gemmatimonadales bacterium]|nr:putative metal-dependent hydrolase [Gemmatimonadales bacterium]